MGVTTFVHPVMTSHSCKACGTTSVRLGLRTDYSDYLRCDACGNWWQEHRRNAPRPSGDGRRRVDTRK